MPNIFHQSVEDILKAATPEQRLLWNYIFLRWGERVPISQFCFNGTLAAGNELITYNANKIYFAYQLNISGYSSASNAPGNIQLNDLSNVAFFYVGLNTPYWDATAAAVRYILNSTEIKNIWFSRIGAVPVNSGITFVGYRISI